MTITAVTIGIGVVEQSLEPVRSGERVDKAAGSSIAVLIDVDGVLNTAVREIGPVIGNNRPVHKDIGFSRRSKS